MGGGACTRGCGAGTAWGAVGAATRGCGAGGTAACSTGAGGTASAVGAELGARAAPRMNAPNRMTRVLVVSPRLPSVNFRARTQTTSAGIASTTKTIPTVRDPQIKVRIARRGSSRLYDVGMCRNIRPLHNFDPPATQDEVHSAALQYVRKISGCTKPSQVNAEVFERAVNEVADISMRLLNELVTSAPPKDREVEAAKARQRAAARFTA